MPLVRACLRKASCNRMIILPLRLSLETSVLERAVRCGGLVEAVRHQEMVERIGFVSRAPHQLEEKATRLLAFGIGRRLYEENVSRDDHHFAERLLAPDQLDRQAVLRTVLEVPMEVGLIVEGAILRAGAHDAVRVALEPPPKGLELQDGTRLDRDAHSDLLRPT